MSASLIALDWGTSNCRAFLLDVDGNIIDERSDESGVGKETPAQLKDRLCAIVEGWPDMPILACGMVGSNRGIVDAHYLPTPAALSDLAAALFCEVVDGKKLYIVPGLKVTGESADVMRGEETQLLGLLSSEPDYSGIVILPGTHSKWVVVENGIIERFCTFMTGELFATLSSTGILQHSLAEADKKAEADDANFQLGLNSTLSGKVPFLANLFTIRARDVLGGKPASANSAFLSGLCIGGEVSAGQQLNWLQDQSRITIIGAKGLLPLYGEAFKITGHQSQSISGKQSVLKGLIAIARSAELI